MLLTHRILIPRSATLNVYRSIVDLNLFCLYSFIICAYHYSKNKTKTKKFQLVAATHYQIEYYLLVIHQNSHNQIIRPPTHTWQKFSPTAPPSLTAIAPRRLTHSSYQSLSVRQNRRRKFATAEQSGGCKADEIPRIALQVRTTWTSACKPAPFWPSWQRSHGKVPTFRRSSKFAETNSTPAQSRTTPKRSTCPAECACGSPRAGRIPPTLPLSTNLTPLIRASLSAALHRSLPTVPRMSPSNARKEEIESQHAPARVTSVSALCKVRSRLLPQLSSGIRAQPTGTSAAKLLPPYPPAAATWASRTVLSSRRSHPRRWSRWARARAGKSVFRWEYTVVWKIRKSTNRSPNLVQMPISLQTVHDSKIESLPVSTSLSMHQWDHGTSRFQVHQIPALAIASSQRLAEIARACSQTPLTLLHQIASAVSSHPRPDSVSAPRPHSQTSPHRSAAAAPLPRPRMTPVLHRWTAMTPSWVSSVSADAAASGRDVAQMAFQLAALLAQVIWQTDWTTSMVWIFGRKYKAVEQKGSFSKEKFHYDANFKPEIENK